MSQVRPPGPADALRRGSRGFSGGDPWTVSDVGLAPGGSERRGSSRRAQRQTPRRRGTPGGGGLGLGLQARGLWLPDVSVSPTFGFQVDDTRRLLKNLETSTQASSESGSPARRRERGARTSQEAEALDVSGVPSVPPGSRMSPR